MDSNAFEWPLMTIKDMISLKLHRWLTKVSKGFLVGPHYQKKPKQLSLPKETHPTRVKFGFQNSTNSQIPLPAEGDLPQDLLLATFVGNSPDQLVQPHKKPLMRRHDFFLTICLDNQQGSTARCPGGHYWDYYPGTLSLCQVTATHLKIGDP